MWSQQQLDWLEVIKKEEVYLVLLQLPDAERQHGHQEESVENQNQRTDPPPPFCTGTRHDGCFTLSADYRHILNHRPRLQDKQDRLYV